MPEMQSACRPQMPPVSSRAEYARGAVRFAHDRPPSTVAVTEIQGPPEHRPAPKTHPLVSFIQVLSRTSNLDASEGAAGTLLVGPEDDGEVVGVLGAVTCPRAGQAESIIAIRPSAATLRIRAPF